jgi:hypothetical protein
MLRHDQRRRGMISDGMMMALHGSPLLAVLMGTFVWLSSQGIAQAAPPTWPDRVEVWNKVQGPAAAALYRFARDHKTPCEKDQVETTCRFVDLVYKVQIIYDWDEYKNTKTAFAVMWYQPDTGNALWFNTFIMGRDQSGSFRVHHQVVGLVGSPVGGHFNGRDYIVTTATLMPDDARCCPLGRTVWRVKLNDPRAIYLSGYKNDEWNLP